MRAGAVCVLSGLIGASSWRGGNAADPQPYDVTITPTGNADIDQAVTSSATLVSLRDSAAVGPFALLARARADAARFETVLESYGYYDGRVRITIAGRPLNDPELPALLVASADGTPVPVAVSLTPGKLFHLGQIDIQGDVPPKARAALGLTTGAPALAADVLAGRDRLLAELRATGHALARVSEPQAMLHPPSEALDISIEADPGPQVSLGAISFSGLKRTHEAFVRTRLLLHPGEQYDPVAIEAARRDLAGLGPFSSVRSDPSATLDPAGHLPMQVAVTERAPRTVNFAAAYSTDIGGNISASWMHRNLFGDAERLTLSGSATELGNTEGLAPGYRVSADLTLPDWRRRDESISFNAMAVNETLNAYARTAVLGGMTVERKLNPRLTASVGLQASQSYIVQQNDGHNYTLLQTPMILRYDTTQASLDPWSGVRAALTVTPAQSMNNPVATFVISQASASVYVDLGAELNAAPGRTVLAARGLVGAVQGASTMDLPPDQRFYAGGGGSVRGFRFQSIGPQFADGTPQGGNAVDTGSIELRQRIGESYGAVAFVDAGQVGTTGVPFVGNVSVGTGVGARYYTSFGPIRLDVAVPVNRLPGGDAFELYLGIGQSF